MVTLDTLETVGVLGAGQMGSGIAQVAATHGYDVVMRDVEQQYVDAGLDSIDRSLQRFVDRDQLDSADADAARRRITATTELEELARADLVVESIVEEMTGKREAFADLADLTDDDVVLATNTSTLSITSLAAATDRPELVVGVHFMNPAPLMEGVEIVPGEKTSEETVAFAHGFA